MRSGQKSHTPGETKGETCILLLLHGSARGYLWHILTLPLGVGSMALQQQSLVGYIDDASHGGVGVGRVRGGRLCFRVSTRDHLVVVGFRW